MYKSEIANLRKIEGQVRGIQKMIQDERCCEDIITQLCSIKGALARIEKKIFENYMELCLTEAVSKKSSAERVKRIRAIVAVLDRCSGI